jgi:centromere DNA-binding complex CBF3 subunit-like protein
LAQYLFWRFHVGKQEWPDFSSSEAWDTVKLLRGGDPKTPLDEITHRKWIRDIFNEISSRGSKNKRKRGG